MRGSLDDLITDLLENIALGGQAGASTSDLLRYIDQYYAKEDGYQQGEPSSPEAAFSQNVDRSFQEQVWAWLASHSEIWVGEDGRGNGMSLTEIEKYNEKLLPETHQCEIVSLDTQQGTSVISGERNERQISQGQEASLAHSATRAPASVGSEIDPKFDRILRLYTSQERIWFAIAGHGPDLSKLSAMEFALLSIIAAYRERGIIQPEITRLSGQDKRSVPRRTDFLHEKGYIVKQSTYVRGLRTSRCMLKRFTEEATHPTMEISTTDDSLPKDEELTDFTDSTLGRRKEMEPSLRKMINMLNENQIVTFSDLKHNLGVTRLHWRSKVIAVSVRGMETLGWVQRVMAESNYGKKRYKCVKLLHMPDERDWKRFFNLRRDFTDPLRTDLADERDAEKMDDEGYIPDDSTKVHLSSGTTANIETSDDEPQPFPSWTTDRPMLNFLHDIIEASGTNGISSMDLKIHAFGSFFDRPLDHNMSRLVEVWQVSQPLHIRHLAVVRDSALTNRIAHFVHYTFENFKSMVEDGRKSWEAVETITEDKKTKQPSTMTANAVPDLDDFGFPKLDSSCFQGHEKVATLSECVQAAEMQPFLPARKDPVVVKSSEGTYTVSWNRPHKRRQPVKSQTVTPEKVTKSIGRPRKFTLSDLSRNADTLTSEQTSRIVQSEKAAIRYQKRKLQSESKEHADRDGIEDSLTDVLLQGATENSLEVTSLVKKRGGWRPRKLKSALGYFPSTVAHTISKLYPRFVGKKIEDLSQDSPSKQQNEEIATNTPLSTNNEQNHNNDDLLASNPLLPQPVTGSKRGRKRSAKAAELNTDPIIPTISKRQRKNFITKTGHLPLNTTYTQSLVDQATSDPILTISDPTTITLANKHHELPTKPSDPALLVADRDDATPEVMRTIKVKPTKGSMTYEQFAKSLPRCSSGLYVCKPGRVYLGKQGCPPKARLVIFKSQRLVDISWFSEESSSVLVENMQTNNLSMPTPVLDDISSSRATPPGIITLEALLTESPPGKSTLGNTAASSTLESEPKSSRNRPASITLAGTKRKRTASLIVRLRLPPNLRPSIPDALTKTSASIEQPLLALMDGNETRPALGARSPHKDDENATPIVDKPMLVAISSPGNQDTRSEADDSHLPESEAPKKASSANIPSTFTRLIPSGGSMAVLRKKIILEIVEKCGGVFPGDKELWYPFTTAWILKVGGEAKPDDRTIKAAKKALIDGGKLRQLRFTFRNKNGVATTKSIITLMEIDPTDPKVKELERQLIAHDPCQYIPEQADVDKDLRPRRMANQATISHQKEIQIEEIAKVELQRIPIRRATLNKKAAQDRSVEKNKGQQSDTTEKGTKPRVQRLERLRKPSDAARTRSTLGAAPISSPDQTREFFPNHDPLGDGFERGLDRILNPELRERASFGRLSIDEAISIDEEDRRMEERYRVLDQLAWEPLTFRESQSSQPQVLFKEPMGLHSNFDQTHWTEPEVLEIGAGQPWLLDHTLGRFEPPRNLRNKELGNIPSTNPVRKETGPRKGGKREGKESNASAESRALPQTQENDTTPRPRVSTGIDPRIYDSSSHLHKGLTMMDPDQLFYPSNGTFSTNHSIVKIVRRDFWVNSNTKAPNPLPQSLEHLLSNTIPCQTQLSIETNGKSCGDLAKQIEDVLDWELKNPGLANAKHSDWQFVNHSYPGIQEVAKEAIYDLWLSPKDRTQPQANSQPINESTSMGNSKKRIFAAPQLKTRRLTSLKDPKRSAQTIGESRNDTDSRTFKRLRTRAPRPLRYLNAEWEKRLMIAVIVVRTLTGGVEQNIDWVLISKIFPPAFNEKFLHQRWTYILQKYRPQVDKLQEDFQGIFIPAYEDGHVPPLDYDNLEEYDWEWLVDWSTANLESSRGSQLPDLPLDRSRLEKQFDLHPLVEQDTSDLYEINGVASIPVRYNIAHRDTHVVPLESYSPSEPASQLEIAKSWVKSNIVTPELNYDSHAARVKLARIGENNVEFALKALLSSKSIAQENKGRLVPGRNYDISENFLSRLHKNLSVDDFKNAVKYKHELDTCFREKGQAEYSYYANDGAVMAVHNLAAFGRIRMRPVNPPMNPLGLTDGVYKTRSMDKARLHFTVSLSPTDTYIYGNPLLPLPVPPSRHFRDTNEAMARIPIWYDISGRVISVMWELALAAVLAVLVVRPGVGVVETGKNLKGVIEDWEIECVMEWLIEAGIGNWVGRVRWSGVRLEEWWWMCMDFGEEERGQEGRRTES